MGGAPYKFTKEGVDALSSVSAFSYERALMYVYSDSMPLNLSPQPKLTESYEQQRSYNEASL